jgi:hypothetical protein
MRTIITNLTQLDEYLQNNYICQHDTHINEDKQITQIAMHDCPQCSIIHIMVEGEYEHFDQYSVEINYNYSGEYEFKHIDFKHLMYLLIQEKIIK